MSTRRTILFHPLNHIGLGHINRLSVIALALHELDKDVRTPFVVEEAAHVLLDAFGLPYFPLPSSHAMNDSAAWAAWTAGERDAMQVQISMSVLRAIAPQVVVFDLLPSPTFAAAVLKSEIPIVLCMREMRDLAGYLSHARVLLAHVSLILIPHPEGTFGLPDELAAKSCFVGQVVRRTTSRASREHDSANPRIVISGGGGGYPGTVEFYNLAIAAISYLHARYPTLRTELIAGPLFRDWLLLQPADAITVIPFEPDTSSRFAEADVVICQAGYNTVAELEQVGAKTLLVPAERQWDDQFTRAERIAREQRNFTVFRGKTPREFAEAIAELLRERTPNITRPVPDGGIKAARLIFEMVR